MVENLTRLLDNSSLPILSAFILGIMTAISPCPLATNITAIGFISKDIASKNSIFLKGIIYTSGRIISYTGLAFILYLGADQIKVSGFFQQYGEKIIGPVLVIAGLFMLGIIKLNIPFINNIGQKLQKKERKGYWDALMIGLIFALAFCPYSSVLYFCILIPMTITSVSGLYLPVVFAIATGIPVIIFAWLIAYTVSGVGKLFNKLKIFEIWLRKIVALLFIGIGIYYIIIIFF